MERAVALVGGGLKSAVMAALERDRCDLHVLHVQTGTRASIVEQVAFERLCESLGATQATMTSLPHFAELSQHPLFDARASLADPDANAAVPPGYVPGLMPAMLNVAVTEAVRVGAHRILVGTCESPQGTRHTPGMAPDQAKEFYQVFNELLAIMLPGATLSVAAPLIDLSYAEIVKLGYRLHVPFEHTWSCLLGGSRPCNHCLGCHDRSLGFVQAGVADPATDGAQRPTQARQTAPH